MRLQKLQLHPFAGFVDQALKFQAGLNVILGPNEAGKSTLVSALGCALFESTKYHKRHWDKEMKQFLPLGGGDVFEVSLEWSVSGDNYSVAKTWGVGELPRSELVLPGGQSVSSPATVQDRLSEILALKRGTWQNVLMARQSALVNTLADIEPHGEEAADIGELLRKAVLNTDGVSIDRLRTVIEERIADMGKHWDRATCQPERTQAGEHYKTGRGGVSLAWYRRDECRVQVGEHESFAERADSLLAERVQCETRHKELSQFVTANREIVNAIQRRRTLQLEIQEATKKRDDLVKTHKDWVKREDRLETWEKELVKLEKAISELEKQEKTASRAASRKETKKKLDRVQGEETNLENAKNEWDDLPQVPDKLRDRIRKHDGLRKRLAAKLEAGSLAVRVVAKEPLELEIQAGVDDAMPHELAGGDVVELTANGRVNLRGPSWTIEVESLEGDFTDVVSQHTVASNKLSNLFKEANVEDLEALEKLIKAFEDAKRAVEDKQNEIKGILGDETIESLREKCEASQDESSASLEDVIKDLATARHEMKTLEEKVKEARKQLDEWSDEYSSPDDLMTVDIAEAAAGLKKFEGQLSEIPAPESEDIDLDVLEQEFGTKAGQLEEASNELLELRKSQVELGRDEPEISEQEASDLLEEAERKFEQAKNKLEALLRIQSVFEQLLEQLDTGTFDPWSESMTRYAQSLTSERYQSLDLEEGKTVRDTDVEVPFNYLSVGTTTALSLALRLSMAKHFLADREGFLLMDDPMVDLDADRQVLAAEAILEFAEKWQVILFTCHPSHAALLTDSPITLPRMA